LYSARKGSDLKNIVKAAITVIDCILHESTAKKDQNIPLSKEKLNLMLSHCYTSSAFTVTTG